MLRILLSLLPVFLRSAPDARRFSSDWEALYGLTAPRMPPVKRASYHLAYPGCMVAIIPLSRCLEHTTESGHLILLHLSAYQLCKSICTVNTVISWGAQQPCSNALWMPSRLCLSLCLCRTAFSCPLCCYTLKSHVYLNFCCLLPTLCPPFCSADGVARELLAVDSEHGKNLATDAWRHMQVYKHTANQAHPWSRFATGEGWEQLCTTRELLLIAT